MDLHAFYSQRVDRRSAARASVRRPAEALIAVSLFAIGAGLLGLVVDGASFVTGRMARRAAVRRGPVSSYALAAVRTTWGVALLAASSYVLYGALQMRRLGSYRAAWGAAVVAVIPGLGPCCVLGVPLGVWALLVLSRPEVRAEFHESRGTSNLEP